MFRNNATGDSATLSHVGGQKALLFNHKTVEMKGCMSVQ